MGRSAVRLYLDQPLSSGATPAADRGQAHYLRSVMRLGPGDPVLVFNEQDGEWTAEIASLDRRSCELRVQERRRRPGPEPDISLAFAPLKAAQIDFLVQKAVELGVSALYPVMTERTQVTRVNTGRLRANAIEAAEQCERLSVPSVAEPVSLADFLATWPADRPLLAAIERQQAPTLSETLQDLRPPLGLLTGPEGGFAPAELDALGARHNVKAVNLGPRILRAETAAVAGLAVVQALAGDWPNRSGLVPEQ